MDRKLTGKRHAKPSAEQLAARMYRKILAIEKLLGGTDPEFAEPSLALIRNIAWGARADINELKLEFRSALAMISERLESISGDHVSTVKELAQHCTRLLREKETLLRTVRDNLDAQPKNGPLPNEAVTFMSAPLPARVTCSEVFSPPRCRWEHLHKPNIVCAICGHLSVTYTSVPS